MKRPSRAQVRLAHREHVDLVISQLETKIHQVLMRILGRVVSGLGAHTILADGQTRSAGAVSLTDAGIAAELWPLLVDSDIMPELEAAWKQGGVRALRDFLGDGHGIEHHMTAAADEALSSARNRLVGVADEIWTAIQAELRTGLQLGESIPELSDRIMAVADLVSGRAVTIARTEVISASNAGALDTMQALGDAGPATKVWLATGDARTRETHADADGQAVALDDVFDVGGYAALYPGDDALPPEEAVNCRCTLTWEEAAVTPEEQTTLESEAEMAAAANATVHDGAMVALVPSADDAARFAVDGWEPVEQIHTTMAFLGDAAAVTPEAEQAYCDIVQYLAATSTPITGSVHGHAIFNEAGDSPSTNYVVSDLKPEGGEGNDPALHPMTGFHDQLWAELNDYGLEGIPAQHAPWVAHMCIGYGLDPAKLDQAGTNVTYDTALLSIGDRDYRFPLGDGTAVTGAPVAASATLTMEANTMPYKVVKGGGGCPESKPYAVVKESDGTKMGCHASRGEANDQLAALYANEPKAGVMGGETVTLADNIGSDVAAPAASGMPYDLGGGDHPIEWEGILALEGKETGDGREFAPGSLVWDILPLPFSWQPISQPEHQESVLVGLILSIERRDGGVIFGQGCWDHGSDVGTEAARLVTEGFLKGVSVDVDSVKDSDVEVIMPQDAGGADPAGGGEVPLFGPPPDKVLFHSGRIRGATLLPLPAFAEAEIHMLAAVAPTPTGAPDAYDSPVVEAGVEIATVIAAASMVAIPDLPPAWWFDEPTDVELDGALTITDDGRVYGLLAPGNTRHINPQFKGRMVPTDVDYSKFLRGVTVAAGLDGGTERIVTGNLTMACGHARMSAGGEQAAEHYDNSCSLAARIRVGNGAQGPWIAGALFPGVDTGDIVRMMACQASGDWRPTDQGKLGLFGTLLVPVPGFPKARKYASVRYREGALVASAVPVELESLRSAPARSVAGGATIADRIARSVGLDRRSKAAALAAKVKGA